MNSGLKYRVNKAGIEDLEEILALQKLAYISEAEISSDFGIPPLRETLEQLQRETKNSLILKALVGDKIVGSVRARQKNKTCHIGRLMVHPEYRNRGIGKQLMTEMERRFSGCRYELFTGHKSEKNLALYEKLGYKRFKTEKLTDSLNLIYLEKV